MEEESLSPVFVLIILQMYALSVIQYRTLPNSRSCSIVTFFLLINGICVLCNVGLHKIVFCTDENFCLALWIYNVHVSGVRLNRLKSG